MLFSKTDGDSVLVVENDLSIRHPTANKFFIPGHANSADGLEIWRCNLTEKFGK